MEVFCYERDFYDLSYHRRRRELPRKISQGQLVEVSPDRAIRQKDRNERRYRLNRISKDLCKVLQRNDALVACISFATHLLSPAAESVTPLELPKRPLAPRRPDTDFEEEIIRARFTTAHNDFSTRILIDSLKRVNQAILQINVNSSTASQKPTFFYRVTHANLHTFYDADLGFCCARWLQDYDFHEPSKDEFYTHVRGGKELESPYISLTDDPGRAFKYGQYLLDCHISDLHIFVINATKLQQMNIHIEPTTVSVERWRIKYKGSDRLHYVTGSHWLARFWIPAECIFKKVSFPEFKEACIASEIVDSM